MPERWERIAAYSALAAALAVGIWLRAIGLDMSLYGDEITTYQRALATPGYQIAHVDSPLLTLLAHFTLQITQSELGLRLPSFLAGCAGILAVYALAASVAGRAAGVLAAWLLALAPFHLQHSQHARYYALLMLAAILWVWLLERVLNRRDALAWAGFVLTTTWALLVHQFGWPYFAAFLIAAAIWLLFAQPDSDWPQRWRRVGLLAGAACVGCLALMLVYSAREQSPLGITGALDMAPGNGLASEVEGAPRYRLGPAAYAAHLDDLFRPGRKPILFAMLMGAFGLIGLISLLRRRAYTGAAIAAALLLPPLPFMLLNARHPFEARYFSMMLPLGLVAVACGILTIAHWAANRLPAEIDTARRAYARHGVMVLCALALVPSHAAGIARYRADHPPLDWKALHHHIAPMLAPDTIFYNLDPSGLLQWRLRTTRRDFYLKRMEPHGPALYHSLREQVGDIGPESLWELARQHPESNLWFLALQGHGGLGMALLDTHAHEIYDFGSARLWEFGAPTVNLFEQAGFEDEEPDPDPITPVGVVEDGEAYHGSRHLRIQSREMVETRALLPMTPSGRTVSVPLRNAAFAVWNEGNPVGWQAEGDTLPFSPGAAPVTGARTLRIEPGEAPARLVQPFTSGFAPGHDIAVRARAFAETADTLYLGVRYERQGAIERRMVAHPGNGRWLTLQLHASLPPDLNPSSLAIEITRAAEAAQAVELENTTLEVLAVDDALDPDTPHVLSLMLRHDGLRSILEDGNTQHAASLRLLFSTHDGHDDSIELSRFYGSRDWHRLHFRVDPGITIPLGARNLTLQVHLYGTGTVRVDDVQLEAGSIPTPFTGGRRPPHDESLVGLQNP